MGYSLTASQLTWTKYSTLHIGTCQDEGQTTSVSEIDDMGDADSELPEYRSQVSSAPIL